MIFKRYEWRLVLRVILMFITLTITSILVVKGLYVFLVITVALSVYEVIDLIRFQKKAQDEVSQFVESIHYRDFSRHFDVRKAPN
jgi:two-component system nitrogen regulation sensor histidine kinase NtrY